EVPHRVAVQQRIDAADGVDARGLGADEAPQSRRDAEILLQAVEAPAAGGEEDERGGEGRGGLDAGTGPRVGQGGEPFAESKDLLDVGAEPCHHGAGASERGRRRRARSAWLRSRGGWGGGAGRRPEGRVAPPPLVGR